MEYECPAAEDYRNVRSLNRGFLRFLAKNDGLTLPYGDPASKPLRTLNKLTPAQLDRLAATPFLLFSFREREDQYWEQLLVSRYKADLFDAADEVNSDYARLVSAGLGFLWQLARQNPYAVRLISGASLHWCELISELTFFRLLALAGSRTDLLVVRFADNNELWSKLLGSGSDIHNTVREAAQLSALQEILTASANPAEQNLALAACRSRSPRLRVADYRSDR